jgi:hypothetical protein
MKLLTTRVSPAPAALLSISVMHQHALARLEGAGDGPSFMQRGVDPRLRRPRRLQGPPGQPTAARVTKLLAPPPAHPNAAAAPPAKIALMTRGGGGRGTGRPGMARAAAAAGEAAAPAPAAGATGGHARPGCRGLHRKLRCWAVSITVCALRRWVRGCGTRGVHGPAVCGSGLQMKRGSNSVNQRRGGRGAMARGGRAALTEAGWGEGLQQSGGAARRAGCTCSGAAGRGKRCKGVGFHGVCSSISAARRWCCRQEGDTGGTSVGAYQHGGDGRG